MNAMEKEIRKAVCRSEMYKLLAKSFMYPSQKIFDFLSRSLSEDSLSKYLERCAGSFSACEVIVAAQNAFNRLPNRVALEEEYNRLFAHIGSTKCPPYETEYGFDNVFQKTEAMADIAGFYRAYELEIADTNTERADFLGTELEFMSYLAASEAYARQQIRQDHLEVCIDTQQKFVRDHLGRWTAIFAKILANSTQNEFYFQLKNLLEQFLESEIVYLNVAPLKVAAPSKELDQKPEEFSCASCVAVPDRT